MSLVWAGSTTLELLQAVRAIQDRQRDYGMHDSECPARIEERHLAKHFENWPTIPTPGCCCWLTEGVQ